jgi:NDP-sugar pyrophosphorylase family protein
MLPLGAKPIMQHVVEECVAAGIKQIIIVATPDGKPIYEDFFNNPVEKIEKQLASQGKSDRFASVKEVLDMADITVIDLDHMKVNEDKPDFRPEGIEYVYVNGQPVLEEGKYVGGKSGEVVLKPKK